MKDDILKWLSEYDESVMSFPQYIIDKYKIPGKVFKTLLDICVDDTIPINIRYNASNEIYTLINTNYTPINKYWSNMSSESRDLLIDLCITYKKVYPILVFLEFNTKIKDKSDYIRMYFDFIVYFEYIESTIDYEIISIFSTMCIQHIKDTSIIKFISSYVFDRIMCAHKDRMLILLRGFFNVLDITDRNELYKILFKIVSPDSCKILNMLYHKYKDDVRDFIKYYHPLLKSTDPDILRELANFWDMAVTQFYANFLFKSLITKSNISEIYCLLEKLSENYNIVFDKKLLPLLKNDIRLMTHLYMHCKPLLPEVFSNINSDLDQLILKLIHKDFTSLLPYINDILRNTSNTEIQELIINKLDSECISDIPKEVWNMYLKGYKEDIQYCRDKLIKTPLPDPLSLIAVYNSLKDEYSRFKVDLELSGYISEISDQSLILEIRHSDLFISKRVVQEYFGNEADK